MNVNRFFFHRIPSAEFCAVLVVAIARCFLAAHLLPASADSSAHPELVNTCLITNDVTRLVDFYETVLSTKADRTGQQYAQFHTGVGVLAIFSAQAQEKYIPGSADAANNRSAILEFRVRNVDEEYRRLNSVVKVWVKPPTTQPWGTRSVYFRDPDGNLVNFYAPAGTP